MNHETWQQLKSVFHAALELTPEDRTGFIERACNGKSELRAQVGRLLGSHDNAGLFLVAPAVVDAGVISTDFEVGFTDEEERVGHRIGPYEIIRKIGRGGMGTVFLAVRADDHYLKHVAIKLVNRGMDTDLILRRFIMERQILANLEHPNIARMLEGGSTPDGLPYFVMEFIEGEPITEFCDAQRFNNAERLELFRQVCTAIQYAHQNLVVHRDIKPSNILVTIEGVPKLLDFGIAKLLGPGLANETGDATASMVRLMTPEYASPEQFCGTAITTASDIYSLGVVLYELLSGHHPFRDISRRQEGAAPVVLRDEPARPSAAGNRQRSGSRSNGTVAREQNNDAVLPRDGTNAVIRNPKSLRGDLDNIVLKALRKEPARRYASVQEFSEDIRRHLEGLPVGASPDTLAYRGAKFIHRHRVSVFASLFILLSLLAGIAATAWQAHRANLERNKAERRFNETRKLSQYLMTDVFDSLTLLSGGSQVQKDLTQSALRYLDTLAQEENDDEVLLGELAGVYVRLGEVQSSTLHDTRAALLSFQKAVELQRKRISLSPNDAAIKRALVFGLFKTGEILVTNGRIEEHLQVITEIRNLLQEVLDAQPGSVEDMFSLAGNYQARGEIFDGLKRREEAKSDYQNAFRLMTQAISLSKDIAHTPQEQIDLSVKYIHQGEIYTYFEDWENAVSSNRKACELADAVWRDNPAMQRAMRNSTSTHRSLAAALEQVGDNQGALENYQISLRLVSEAGARSGASGRFRRSEAIYTIKVGVALYRVGETTRAIEMVKRGLDLNREDIAEEKNPANVIRFSFEAFQPAADFFLAIGQRDEAIEVYQEWVQNFERLRARVPLEPDLVWTSANLYANLGDIHSAFDRQAKTVSTKNRAQLGNAIRWYQRTLDALNELRVLRDPNSEIQDLTRATEQKLAQCQTQLN
jgi:serine/threonine protein kinase